MMRILFWEVPEKQILLAGMIVIGFIILMELLQR